MLMVAAVLWAIAGAERAAPIASAVTNRFIITMLRSNLVAV